MNRVRKKTIWRTSGLLVAVVFVAALMILIQEVARARDSAHAVKIASDMRQYGVGMAHYRAANTTADRPVVPSTWTWLEEYLVETPSRHPQFVMPRLTQAEIEQVAEQSWEFVLGRWLSRMPADHESDSGEVIVGLIREHTETDRAVVALLLSDGRVTASHRTSLERIRDALDADRLARERLNLAPLPDEFRTWLLTGEPTSVGDGTFVPPQLGERD